MRRVGLILAIFLSACTTQALFGASEAPPTLTVATKSAPPFVIVDDNGELSGISIDVWNHIAAELQTETTWTSTTLDQVLTLTAAGKVDAGIAAITATPEREQQLNFSHPYYTTGLGIAVNGSRQSGWITVISKIFSWEFASAVCALVLVLLLAGFATWLFERRKNEDFGGTPVEGLGRSFWWSAVTMTTVGYGDMAPKTVGGRLVALCWMFASIIIISSFTAAIASSLTIGGLDGSVTGPEDLRQARVAVIRGTSVATWAEQGAGTAIETDDLNTALSMLADGTVEAVVHDRPLLRYAAAQFPTLEVLPMSFQRHDYVIVLPSDSESREAINLILLRMIKDGRIDQIIDRYL